MSEKQITITIRGPVRSGKSAVARLILDACQQEGIPCTYQSIEGGMPAATPMRALVNAKTTIIIVDEQTSRT